MTTLLVLGSNSPAGQDFIDLVLSETRWHVIAFSRSAEKPAFLLRYKSNGRVHPVTFFRVDINELAVNSLHIDYIANFAAQSEVEPSWKNPEDWFRTNVAALTNPRSFWANKDHSGLTRYLQMSTPEVYGSGPHKPGDVYNPSTPYAMSKASADWLLSAYRQQFGLPVVSVQPANYYGPRQQLWKIVPKTILACVNKTKFPLHANGEDLRCFVHMRDASRGILAALQHGEVGGVYPLTDGRLLRIRDVVAFIALQFGKRVEDVTFPAPRRKGNDEVYHMYPDPKLDWRPEISFEQGIDETIKWMRDNWDALQSQPMEYVHKP